MNDTELLTEILGAVRELAERVERIEATVRENCNAANRILAKRQRDRERIAAQRAEAKNVALQIECRATKETEAEIRELPPTPPIENKGEEKENDNKNKNPRVRACVRHSIPSLEEVREFAAKRHSKVDPEYFYNYYKAKGWPLEDWKAAFAIWEKNNYSRSRLPPESEDEPTIAYTAEDWSLCRERCANCTGGCCSANVQVPPDKRPDHPIPPEECPHFKAKGAAIVQL